MPDIASLLAGVIPLNPNASNPLSGVRDSNNLNSVLDTILGKQSQAPVQPAPVNPIVRVLESLATGFATATSQNPSAALLDQIKTVQARRDADQNRQQTKADQLDLLRTQVLLQDLQNKQAEQRTIAAETRGEAAQVRKEKRDQDAAVLQFNREMGGRERLSNLDFEQNRKLATLKNQFDVDILAKNQEFQRGLTEAESKDRKTAKTAEVSLALIAYGTPVESAYSIARKFLNDEKLSSGESKALDNAIRQQQAAAKRASRGGGSGGGDSAFALTGKQAFGLLQKFAENPMVQLQDGSIVEVTALATDVDGSKKGANGSPVARYLSPQESVTYAAQTVLPAIAGAFAPQQKQQLLQVNGTPNAVLQTQLDRYISAQRQAGVSDETIKAQLEQHKKQYPNEADAVDSAFLRSKLAGTKRFVPGQKQEKKLNMQEQRKKIIQEGSTPNNLILPENIGNFGTLKPGTAKTSPMGRKLE